MCGECCKGTLSIEVNVYKTRWMPPAQPVGAFK